MRHTKSRRPFESRITICAKTKPRRTLPTSPIKTRAFGRLKGKNPKHDSDMQRARVARWTSFPHWKE